ncbi:hypothetical protein A2U01_0000400 [Trifolium medium]|uniref:Putative plant transposon protein domain-containing protein n=1 Tax=Trifolium medium TaxID=97028 RepID=A0A392LXF8_9FABA|nr:hypothetical protein [Trifolium medium]
MARTKELARKRVHDPISSSSISSSPPRPRSSSSPHDADSVSPSPINNMQLTSVIAAETASQPSKINPSVLNQTLNVDPITTKFPSPEKSPSPDKTPSPAKNQTTSVKIKKSKTSTKQEGIRKSTRIMMGTGKKPVIDTTIHNLDTDSENTLSNQGNPEPITTTRSEPTPTFNPRTKIPSVSASKPKPKKDKAKGKEKVLFEEFPIIKGIKIPLVLPENKEEFEKFWKPKPIAPARNYELETLYNGGLNLYQYIDPQGWVNFVRIKETVYPRVVQSFYFNAEVHADKSLIISWVKGQEVRLTPEIISDVLSIPCDGAMVYGPSWYDDLQVNKKELILLFSEHGAQIENPTASSLNTEFKVLHNICQYCIFPRFGSLEKVTDNDLMVLYHLKNKYQLNLPYVIIHHMIKTAESGKKRNVIPYGMLLTKIFKKLKVDLKKESSENVCHTFSVKNTHHMKKVAAAEDPVVGLKRKREEEEGAIEKWEQLLTAMMKNFKPNNPENPSDTIPSSLDTSLHPDSTPGAQIAPIEQRTGKSLKEFYSSSTPINKSMFSPLITSSQATLNTFMSTEFAKKFFQSNPLLPSHSKHIHEHIIC